MPDKASDSNGAIKWRQPGLPMSLVVVSLVIAVGGLSVLLYVLFKRTTGPGEVLNHYYVDVARGDCNSSWGLLSSSLQGSLQKDPYCLAVQAEKGTAPSGFTLDSVLLRGPQGTLADVTVTETGPGAQSKPVAWVLRRQDNTWLVQSPPDAGHPELRP